MPRVVSVTVTSEPPPDAPPPKQGKWLPIFAAIPLSEPTFVAGVKANFVQTYGRRHGMKFMTKEAPGGVLVWRVPA